MKSCTGLIFILLGLLFKASSGDNSTQVYYIELHIEAEAYSNFTNFLLNGFTMNVDNATITNFNLTTECNSHDSGNVICTCHSGFSWSDEVCANYSQCCEKNDCAFATPNPRAMCISENKVIVKGSFTATDQPFTSYLADSTSAQYQQFVRNYTTKLITTFSTLDWFESLKITGLRQGSVIGDFEMLVTAPFTSAKLEKTTNILIDSNNITLSLIVTGLVKISSIPDSNKPISYDTFANITCSTTENLGTPAWTFTQNANTPLEITNGTEANVIYNILYSTVSITKTTEVWKGRFTCDYQKSNVSIIYTASLYLDIALLPQILIISMPQFPDCRGSTKQFFITIQCIVPNTTEPYKVTWTGNGSKSSLVDESPVPFGSSQIAYQVQKGIYCDENLNEESVKCEFQNRNNQTTSSTVIIPIIKGDSLVCQSDSTWSTAKSDYTAIMICSSNSVGLQMRNCINGQWEDVISLCINQDLNNLLSVTMNLQRGLGIVAKNANSIFGRLSTSTNEDAGINTYANVNASVDVLQSIYNASNIQNSSWNTTMLHDFMKSSSNLLNGSLNDSWQPVANEGNYTLPIKYLWAVEGIIQRTNLTAAPLPESSQLQQDNMQIIIYNKSNPSTNPMFQSGFGVNITSISSNISVQASFKNLDSKLPNYMDNIPVIHSGVLLSVSANNSTTISMQFKQNRLRNHDMYCVYWDLANSQWSQLGCKWSGPDNPGQCDCNHLSSFTILMAQDPIDLPFSDLLTYIGLGCSIGSLALCLLIEFLVWNTVVKTNIAHFRHTVLVNIMLCLLIADCSFLAASNPSSIPSNWCLSLTVMQHFCYLAAFFWMLCLSLGLLHQVIFVFVHLRKKVYLGLCVFLGYVCPLIIVVITFITFGNGRTGSYYSSETCWLIYESALTGSIHAFVFPVFVIVFVNMFTMVVVITRILKPTLSEGSTHDEKEIVRSIVKTVVLLTPTLGITWIMGFFVLKLDLTTQPYAQIVNYAFIFFNSFQGFFILLTGCLGEQKVRDALVKLFRPQKSVNNKSEISTRTTSATKQK